MLNLFRSLESLLERAAGELEEIPDHSDMMSHYDSAAQLAEFIRSCVPKLKDNSISDEDLHELYMIFLPTSEFDDYGGSASLSDAICLKLGPLDEARARSGGSHKKVLEKRFINTWNEATGQPGARLFAVICKHYSETGRAYHNMNHVRECLAELTELTVSAEARLQIELAIWFHDVIYNPLSKDNEERSSEFFRSHAQVDSPLVAEVSRMILATKNHVVPQGASDALKLFLDIDLSILGKSEERFREYEVAIREEYILVPEFIYKKKRQEVLKGFFERPELFFTAEFRVKFEEQARRNLKQALKKNLI